MDRYHDVWDDWVENKHGEIDTREHREEYPEGFEWHCCKKDGTLAGCKAGRHWPVDREGDPFTDSESDEEAGKEEDEEAVEEPESVEEPEVVETKSIAKTSISFLLSSPKAPRYDSEGAVLWGLWPFSGSHDILIYPAIDTFRNLNDVCRHRGDTLVLTIS